MVDKIQISQPGQPIDSAALNAMLRSVAHSMKSSWPVTITHLRDRIVIRLDETFLSRAGGAIDIDQVLRRLFDRSGTVFFGMRLTVWNIVADFDALNEIEDDSPALAFTLDTGICWVKHAMVESDETGDGGGGSTAGNTRWMPMHTLNVPTDENLHATGGVYDIDIPGAMAHTDKNTYVRRGSEWVPIENFTDD